MKLTIRKCKLNGVVRSGPAKAQFMERIETIVKQVSKISILSALHIHFRLNKIIENGNTMELQQEFSKPSTNRLFENDFYAFYTNARGNK